MKKRITLCMVVGMIAMQQNLKAQELELLAQGVRYAENDFFSEPLGRESTLILQAYGMFPIAGSSDDGIGMSAWAFYFSQPIIYNYHELIVGLSAEKTLGSHFLQIGLGAGGETWDGDNGFRAGWFLYWESGEKLSAEYYSEAGQVAEFWYQTHVTYKVTDVWAVGMYGQTEPGMGARVIATLAPESPAPVSLWLHGGHKGVSFGLQMNLGR